MIDKVKHIGVWVKPKIITLVDKNLGCDIAIKGLNHKTQNGGISGEYNAVLTVQCNPTLQHLGLE